MKNSNVVACFVNEEAFANKVALHRYLDGIKQECEIFIGHGISTNPASLCININARYEDFEFVVLLNPMGRLAFEHSMLLHQRQDYYLRSIIGNLNRLHKIIELLKDNPYEGLLMPSRDFFKSYFERYYEQWTHYSEEIKGDFSRNGIEFQFSLDDEPLRLENNCAIFRTAAIKNFSAMKLEKTSQEKMAFLLPLFIQHNGFLPAYCDDPQLIANGMSGRQYFEIHYPLR